MGNDIVRIGIVGAGANTVARHVPGLKAIEGVEIISVCNRTDASSERVSKQFNIPKIYDKWQDLVAADDTNAIVIGTWPYLHCPVTLAALAADKHVMCEARMAMTAEQAHKMLDAAKAKPQLIAQVVPSPFTLTVDKTIKKLISEDYLGKILAVEIRHAGPFLDTEASLQWRQDFDLSGYNTLALGIWYEAVMRWIGQAENVMAKGKIFVTERKDSQGVLRQIRIPEHLDVIADMACGAQMHMQLSSVTGLSDGPVAFIFGTKATLKFSDDKLYQGRSGDSELKEVLIEPELKGRWRVETEFVNAIRGSEQITHTTFDDGVQYMEFTEAVIRSIETSRQIKLPLLRVK